MVKMLAFDTYGVTAATSTPYRKPTIVYDADSEELNLSDERGIRQNLLQETNLHLLLCINRKPQKLSETHLQVWSY